MNRSAQLVLDQIAIGISALCALHCLLAPLALVLVPTLAAAPLADENFHRALVLLVVPASAVALSLGCRRHKDWFVLLAGFGGMAGLVAAAIFGHEVLGESGERIATVVMTILLAAGHVRNFRLCRNDGCEHTEA